ncbi:MAG: hypothetical protein HRT71_03095 [Flavobacteriales bacterium]|nr:hypothetical protein [Flavobacteriales bacterium]
MKQVLKRFKKKGLNNLGEKIRSRHVSFIVLLFSALFIFDVHMGTGAAVETLIKAEDSGGFVSIETENRTFLGEGLYFSDHFKNVQEIGLNLTPIFDYVDSYQIIKDDLTYTYQSYSPKDVILFPYILLILSLAIVSGKLSINAEMSLFVLSMGVTVIFFFMAITSFA